MTQMTLDQLAGHFASKYGDPEKYDDLFQEAWVAILECRDKGMSDKDMYWHVRSHVSLYRTYRDRTVPLPARSGTKALAEQQEVNTDIQDHIATTNDHAQQYELYSEIQHLRKALKSLPEFDQKILAEHYENGLTWREIADKYGQSHVTWQKWHTNRLNQLKGYQEGK